MAVEGFVGNLTNVAGEPTGNILRSAFGILANIPGVDLIVKIVQVAGALFIVYLVFLIMKTIAGFKSASRLKTIAKNVEEINSKLDVLVGKKKKK
jgi:threonine/homoserine/homoserine lactone efflux protein